MSQGQQNSCLSKYGFNTYNGTLSHNEYNILLYSRRDEVVLSKNRSFENSAKTG